jgi:hypothetical protein
MTARERRRNRRYLKRTQVRFQVQGDPAWRLAHSKDISGCGVFIATPQPSQRGTRVRMEIGQEGADLVLEGTVSRRVIIVPHLRKLGDSGMGVRFLRPEEIVHELLYRAAGAGAAGQEQGSEDRVYRVYFENSRHFLQVFVNDIGAGGLFVATQNPAQLDELITVELFPPGKDSRVERLEARVVRRHESDTSSGSGGPQTPGMGVAFTDPSSVVRRLRPHVERLQHE